MDYDGEFHEVETNGKLFLVYHHPKYRPIPQINSTFSSSQRTNHDHPPIPVFLCPYARGKRDYSIGSKFFFLSSSPEYVLSTTYAGTSSHHHVLPLFWCNNEKIDAIDICGICSCSNFGTDYYYCGYCDRMYHKECVESPLKIKHPYYPRHSLKLGVCNNEVCEVLCCGRIATGLVYHCTVFQIFMHPICAMKLMPFVIDQQKIHDHPLTFFPRQTSLICNVCGLLRKAYPTYVCFRCNFVAHRDCMYSPHTIKISYHHHRISFVSSLWYGKWSCGVCRQSIDGDYGAYTCNKCGDYAAHSRCALRKDVWGGEELEGLLEENDITQDAPPFWKISEGVIHYFLHDHHLRLEENIPYDENNLCQVCVMPIFEEELYSCMDCDFILHEICLKARRRVQYALHPHPLTLKAILNDDSGSFWCKACGRSCGGFVYECPKKECEFKLDVRCASISEPFDYQGHEHPLFLSLDPGKEILCEVCKYRRKKLLNCIKCDFIVCIRCATLPYKARYKNDEHFLTLSWREEKCEKNWCEECEDIVKTSFYWCNDCCTIIHTACLLSKDPYLKPGQSFELFGNEIKILAKSTTSRPICHNYNCKKPCQGKIFTRNNRTACSRNCASYM